MLHVEIAPANTATIVGFDTIAKIDAAAAQRLVSAGLRFAVRYVSLGRPSPEALDALELDLLARAGLGVMAVQFARVADWNSVTGRADGEAAARGAIAAGLPPETTVWCDMEGAIPNAELAIAYGNGWYDGATSGGIADPGVYVGAGLAPPLTEAELFHSLPFRRYWRSFSAVNNVQTRGYQMLQLFPGDQSIAGVEVDLDVLQTDYLGSRPVWAVL
jgi:hypothetical protein